MADDSWWLDPGELDEEQEKAIALPADGDYLLIGPPGSGKTNLLLLRAKYLSMVQRPNWVVLIFTRSLRDFVAIGSEKYELDPGKILTVMKFFQRLLEEHGYDTGSLPEDFENRRLAVASELGKILDAKPGLAKHLECVLVDEIQDCLPQEVEIFLRVAKNVFFVGDLRQKVYRTQDVRPSSLSVEETWQSRVRTGTCAAEGRECASRPPLR
jgi:superfamily I DNA and RNA helicase